MQKRKVKFLQVSAVSDTMSYFLDMEGRAWTATWSPSGGGWVWKQIENQPEEDMPEPDRGPRPDDVF